MKNRKVWFYLLLSVCLIGLMLGAAACRKATVTEYHIDRASCNGCGNCIQACPYDAIIFDADQKAVIDQSKCRQCGECVPVCPQNAVY